MYNTKYILGFSNDLNEFYEIFFDFLNYIGGSSAITGADNCLTLRCTGGDENKLFPILGTECIVNILVQESDTISIDDFIAEYDNDVRVTVYKDRNYTKSIYQGFIVVEDNSQPYLDPPFTLSVRALDGLGLLKNVDLTDANGDLFTGIMSIEDWIGNILMKTGQTLDLRVYFPFYTAVGQGLIAPLQQVFLHAMTFQIGEITTTIDPSVDIFLLEMDDCYTALEKIIRCLRCRLFQEDGVWNIVSLYSYADPTGYYFNQSKIDTLIAGVYHFAPWQGGIAVTYNVNVGSDQIIHPAKDDGVLFLKVATQWVKLNYDYNQALDKICNEKLGIIGVELPFYNENIWNFTIDKTFNKNPRTFPNAPVNQLVTMAFDMFCWNHFDGYLSGISAPLLVPGVTATGRAFIRIVYNNLVPTPAGPPTAGYEILRTGILDPSTTPGVFSYVQSSTLLIDANDVLQISMSWRLRAPGAYDFAAGVMAVYLTGDDGTFWALSCINDNASFNSGNTVTNPNFKTEWVQVDDRFALSALLSGTQPAYGGTLYVQTADLSHLDLGTWQNVQVNQTEPADYTGFAQTPINGTVDIYIVNQFGPAANNANEFWFKDLNITIIPYLQGSYLAVKGDYNFSSTDNFIKQYDTETVEISDSPKRYFQGALLDKNSNIIPPTWHRIHQTESFRFTQLMERIVFNNLCHRTQKIEGTFRGLTYVDNADSSIVNQAGFINSYFFSDHPTPTKKFILTSFEKDYTTATGRHVFVEILKDENDDGWLDPAKVGEYLFQYIFLDA